MSTQDKQFKINSLKEALTNFGNTDFKMTGISIIRQNSSDNWLFNTDVDINEVVPVVLKALEKEINQLEEELLPLIEAEQKQAAIDAEIAAKEEAEKAIKEQAANEISYKRAKLYAAQDKGKLLVETYLNDNYDLMLDSTQTLQQLQKFAAIKELLLLGSLRVAGELIAAAKVDDIFTQERKDKYLTMLL